MFPVMIMNINYTAASVPPLLPQLVEADENNSAQISEMHLIIRTHECKWKQQSVYMYLCGQLAMPCSEQRKFMLTS